CTCCPPTVAAAWAWSSCARSSTASRGWTCAGCCTRPTRSGCTASWGSRAIRPSTPSWNVPGNVPAPPTAALPGSLQRPVEHEGSSSPTPRASYEADPEHVRRVLLLYSGGLDTSVMLKWIQDFYAAEVV